jgi:16S rRNA C1402 (ribose-2'-O) methylase RsmI
MNALGILSTAKPQEVICTLVRKELCNNNYGFNGFVKNKTQKRRLYLSGLEE